MYVENMLSNSGREVPNQFIIETDDGRYFQSYKSIIAFAPHRGKVQLDVNYWDYSKTTSKYRNNFLGINTSEIKKAIKCGDIILTDLNGRGMQ